MRKANQDSPDRLLEHHDGACNHLGLLGVQARDHVALGEWGEQISAKKQLRAVLERSTHDDTFRHVLLCFDVEHAQFDCFCPCAGLWEQSLALRSLSENGRWGIGRTLAEPRHFSTMLGTTSGLDLCSDGQRESGDRLTRC